MSKIMHTCLIRNTWREAERHLQVRSNAQNGLQTRQFFDSRIVAGHNKTVLRIYNCQKRTDEELSKIIYRSTKPKYSFDLGWSISLSRDTNIQIIVANRKFFVVEEPR